jgi:hypothetical protein
MFGKLSKTLHALTEALAHGGGRACAAMRWLNTALALLPLMRTAAFSPARAQGGTDDEAEEHDLSVVR